MDRLGDDRASGLTNAELAELERIVGHQLPFEVGMLLVMGQPETPPWVQWDDDPADGVVDMVCGVCRWARRRGRRRPVAARRGASAPTAPTPTGSAER